MALKDDVRGIFDFLTRHQIFLEGVKNWHASDFYRYLKQLRDALREYLFGLNVGKLNELTRRKLDSVLSQVAKINKRVLGNWGSEFLLEFRKFARIDTIVQKAGFAAKSTKSVTDITVGSVWKRLSDAINPASGVTYKEGAEQVIARAYDYLQTVFKQGWTNALELKDFMGALFGDENNFFKGGTLGKIWKDAKAYISTGIQHAASAVSETLGSAVSDCYRWCSIIDDITGQICRALDGEVFRYGDGPTTPAHPHCRSHTIPWPCDFRGPLPDFDEWITDQPDEFVKDALGDSFVQNTGAKLKEFFRDRKVTPITADEFELKLALMVI